MKKIYIFLLVVLLTNSLSAQELNAHVEVTAPQVQNVNTRTVELLQRVIFDFLNNRSWTTNTVSNEERIDCSFNIIIHSFDGVNRFAATAQINSARPVFATNYNSPVLSFKDNYFNFTYTEGEQLDYSDSQNLGNLSSMLAFYAYTIIGMDLDTFSLLGGTAYYNKGKEIVNYSQSGQVEGWRGVESMDDRYWLSNNLLDRKYSYYREFFYKYHRLGLDRLTESEAEAKNIMLDLVKDLNKVDRINTGNVLSNCLFTAKSNEFVGLFSKLPNNESVKMYNVLLQLDPNNASKYEKLKN